MRGINNLFVTVVIALLTLSLLAWYRKYAFDLVVKESLVDGNEYLVRKLPDAQQAADRLARIKNLVLQLITHLKRKYPENQDDERNGDGDGGAGDLQRGEAVNRLSRRFKPENLSEASRWTNGTSYSLNKGQQIVMCLRHKPDDGFVDLNTLVFVILHELAHLATKSRGHTAEFWANFKFILLEAMEIGIYDYHAYHQMPIEYCGTHIKDTPLK